jgi:hypothetical protein
LRARRTSSTTSPAGPIDLAWGLGQALFDERPQAIARVLQRQHEHDAEHDDLVVAAAPEKPGQQRLQLVLEDLHHAGADERSPDMAHTADHRHEEVFDAHLQAEWRRIHRALEVREQPTRDAGQQRSQHEGGDLDAEAVHAHRFGHRRTTLDRSQRAAGTRIEQMACPHRAEHDDDPQQVEEAAPGVERDAEECDRRHAEQPVVLAEGVDVAEHVEQAQAPGNGGQREEVSRHAQRHPAEHECGDQRDRESHPHRDPRGDAVDEREVRRGVRA